MKQLNKCLTQLLLIISLMLPWATTVAQETITLRSGSNMSTSTVETFDQAGVITKLGYEKFTVNGRNFRFAPGASLNSNDNNRKRFSDFKLGDHIYFKGKILDGVNYVDIIFYETPDTT